MLILVKKKKKIRYLRKLYNFAPTAAKKRCVKAWHSICTRPRLLIKFKISITT